MVRSACRLANQEGFRLINFSFLSNYGKKVRCEASLF
jgi:hypothetical protein